MWNVIILKQCRQLLTDVVGRLIPRVDEMTLIIRHENDTFFNKPEKVLLQCRMDCADMLYKFLVIKIKVIDTMFNLFSQRFFSRFILELPGIYFAKCLGIRIQIMDIGVFIESVRTK